MQQVYIVEPLRTAIGNFGGSLKSISASGLGSTVIREILKRTGINPSDIDEVILGNVLQAGQGQNPARQASIKSEIPVEIPAVTINKVCGSGLYSINLARQAILAGEADCIIAGGMESMSNTPYALMDQRFGSKMGDTTAKDIMVYDGLWDVFNQYHMGITAENIVNKYNISREEQDRFAVDSQNKAESAQTAGKFKDEIVPVTVPQRKGDPLIFVEDEFIKTGSTYEKVSRLRPAFDKKGTVTAATSSGINDGAAAMLVVSEKFLKKYNLNPSAVIISAGSAGVDPAVMGTGPIPAMKKVLKKAGLSVDNLDLIEANEAFASQAISVMRELELDSNKVNVNGGAIALGHPIGASGARILTTLIHEMKKQGSTYGAATLCIGGGMGEAMIVKSV